MAIETPSNNGTNKALVVLAVIAVIGIIAVSSFKAAAPVTINSGPQSPDRNILTVSGTSDMKVAPDEAVIQLQVVTNDSTAKGASSQNQVLLNKVMSALKAQGLEDKDIETTNVYLNKLTEWDYKNMVQVDKGYQQQTSLKVTIKDLKKVGDVLDAAVQAGANSVQDISFELQPATEQAYKKQALAAAASSAKDKAQTLADASGAHLGKITALSENSYNVIPYYYGLQQKALSMDSAGSVAAPSTPINPQQVSLSVSVSLSYELN